MNYQPIETKNYRKPKITKRPVAMLVIGIAIGVALAALAFLMTGMETQKNPGIIQTTKKNELPDLNDSVGLAYNAMSSAVGEITGIGACTDTEIIIPKYIDGLIVTSIAKHAFEGCGDIKSVIMPESVTKIGDYAFRECTGLTSIVIPKGVTNIGTSSFLGCESLANIAIPEGVTKIGISAFQGCKNLNSITIPRSATVIENYVFHGCGNLSTINYSGNISQWKNISKRTGWDTGTPDYTVYCADGSITKDGMIDYN